MGKGGGCLHLRWDGNISPPPPPCTHTLPRRVCPAPHTFACLRLPPPHTLCPGVRALRPMCLYGKADVQAQLLKGDVIMALVECTKPSAGGTDPLLLQVRGEGERWGGGHRESSFIHLCGWVCSPPPGAVASLLQPLQEGRGQA